MSRQSLVLIVRRTNRIDLMSCYLEGRGAQILGSLSVVDVRMEVDNARVALLVINKGRIGSHGLMIL